MASSSGGRTAKKLLERASRSSSSGLQPAEKPSKYEAQKRRDWRNFGKYVSSYVKPPATLLQFNSDHVIDFLQILDQFGKTKVHLRGCMFFGHPEAPARCSWPLKQAWGTLDALIGRLRAAYEENGGSSDTNPFASGGVKAYLKEVKHFQSMSRGIHFPFRKKNKKNKAVSFLQAGESGDQHFPIMR